MGRVVEETLGVDTVQITPLLGDISAQQSSRLSPSARLTIGKRHLGPPLPHLLAGAQHLTRDEIILLEYNQSDRLSWIVSQNEDRTYAIDVRVRHVF